MSTRASYSLVQLASYFLKLGSVGFGGPVALVGYMYRDLVESRRWIAEDDYREGLALAQLMPGPLAAQLAMYRHTHRANGASGDGVDLESEEATGAAHRRSSGDRRIRGISGPTAMNRGPHIA